MTSHTPLSLLRIGSAKDLTRSVAEGELKESLTSTRFYI